ncbi:SatD family protein [Proteiniclasticum sp. C24MP]|uniref:SatD family protein n=1 Tax=Proteiniclasticum sp. C24MP TaxID=3374101 RepID=UPI0037544E15
MYFMIIGELRLLKPAQTRSQVEKMLSDTLKKVNGDYKEVIASNFSMTIGNEFQGLLSSGDSVMEIIDEIRFRMDEVELFFGIGVGDIETRISKLSIGIDGPAYWNAREALLALNEDNDYGSTKIRIEADENRNLVRIMNETIRLCGYIESRWRDTQKEVVKKSVLLHGHDLSVKQIELAGELGLSTQALNQRIQSSGYYNYIRARKEISLLLEAEWGKEKRQ